MGDTTTLNRGSVIINDFSLYGWKKYLIAQDMSNDTVFCFVTCDRSYSASFRQSELVDRTILKSSINKIFLYGKDIPQEIHHKFLSRFLPFTTFYRSLVSPIQVVGITNDFFISHNLFTVLAILTVVNYIRLCYLSLRNGQHLLLCWLIRESGRTPLEFDALL